MLSQTVQSPVNNVALAMQPGAPAIADPGLVQQGTIGLMLFEGIDGSVSRSGTAPATPSELLGGNLPGLVVPRDGEVARDFGLRGGGTQLIALLDFADLGVQDQSAMRAAVTRLAPAAQSAEATGYGSYQARRAVSNMIVLSGSALVLLVVIVGGGAVALGNRAPLRSLVDMGSTLGSRRRLAARWVGVPVVAFMLGLPLAYAGATVSGLGVESSYGWLWVVPLLVGLMSNLALLPFLLRVPARSAD